MLTKKDKKNQIATINRKVAEKFIFDAFQNVNCMNLPKIIIELCLCFFNPIVDEWSMVLKHPGICVDGSIIRSNNCNQSIQILLGIEILSMLSV